MFRFIILLSFVFSSLFQVVAAVPPGDDYKHGYVKNSNIHAQLENSDLYLNHYKHSIKIKHTHKHYLINKNSNVKNKKHKENYKRQF